MAIESKCLFTAKGLAQEFFLSKDYVIDRITWCTGREEAGRRESLKAVIRMWGFCAHLQMEGRGERRFLWEE